MLNKPTGDMLNAAGSATPQGLGTAAAGTSTAYSREDHVHAIPTLSGDVTNDGASVTVAKLQSSPVASTTPASGQVLTWDGAQWAPATNSSGGGGGANGLTYYLNQGTAADAPTTGITGTPHQLGRTGESGQTTVTSGTLTQNVWTLVAGFVSESTPIDPDVTLIPAGLWDFNIWAYGDANSNAGTSIRCRVYKYNGSALTEIASPSSDQVINGTSAQYSLSVLVPQTTLELTDRIYVAIEARATGNGHSVTAQFGDSTPSHVHTSLPLVGGTGLWKSLAGVLQSPASLLVNADVDAAAGIAWSKIAPSYLGARVKVVGRDAATIQGCIDLCTDADGEHPYTVLIPPIAGSYTESLTLKGSVSLVGLTAPLNADAVQITGAHTLTPASAQANTNRINFQNLTFISSGTGNNTITCSSATKYFSKLTFSGCIFGGDKADTYSHLKTNDNVSVYVDNCRFESSAGGTASAGITQGNGPLYLSNNTTFDVSGRAIDVPVAAFPVTRTATVTAGVGGSTTMTLTSGDTNGLAVGMKISGINVGPTVTIVSLTAPSTVVMSTPPKTSGSFLATFGQTPYVEIHDSVLAAKGAETVRLGNGLLACNTSNFTNTASGGSGINMLTANTVIGIVNSSFSISDATAYTITAAAATCYAALESVSFSNSFLAAYSTLIGANVTVADYSARATSIENGGTGATTRQAALNALAGAVTSTRVLAGDGTNITLRALAAADIPSLAASKITSGQLAVAQGGTGAATLTGLVKGTGTTAMVAATAGTDYVVPSGNITGTAGNVTGTVAVANGGTGATNAATARTALSAAASGANTDITSVALTSGSITTAPTTANDIVNKTYADSIGSGVNFHDAADYATTAALSAAYTYANGTSGVGATITANANGTLTIDGYTFVSGDAGKRILIKNETGTFSNNTTPSAAFNGVYTLTTVGTASVRYVLTRATDYDTSGTGTNEINQGDFVLVLSGSTLANTAWVQQARLPITVGTTSLSFTQFSAAAAGVSSFQTSLAGLTPSTATTGAVTLGGTLGIGNGGTGAASAAAAITALTGTQTAGRYLRSDGANAALAAIQAGDVPTLNQNTTGTAANVTGLVAIANGGTGANNYQSGLNALAGGSAALGGATGQPLISNGTNVVFGAIDLADNFTSPAVTGILRVANGGTGTDTACILAALRVSGFNESNAGTTLNLSQDVPQIVWIAGTGATTVNLPDMDVSNNGIQFRIINKGTGTATVKLFGTTTTLCTIAAGSTRLFIGNGVSNVAANWAFLPAETTNV